MWALKITSKFAFKKTQGANSGIGYNCAVEIAKRKGTVHLVCRNAALGTEAKENIIKATQNENVFLHILDVSQPKQVVDFTKKFGQDNPTLNVLVCY